MTAAHRRLPRSTTAEAPSRRRFRLADPSMILWLVMIAILVFLIASPMVRLVVSSFQEPETGAPDLANYVEAYGRARHCRRCGTRCSSAPASRCSRACSACRSPGRSRAPTCRPRASSG